MKKLLLIKLFVLISLCSYSQDVMHLLNGQRLKCTILSVDREQVSYKLRTADREYVIDKKELKKLVYEDGSELYIKNLTDENGSTNAYDNWKEEQIFRENSKFLKRENGFFGPRYFINELSVSKGAIEDVLSVHEPFMQDFRRGHRSVIMSNIVGSISGFAFGYTLGIYLGSGLDFDQTPTGLMLFSGLIWTSSLFAISRANKTIDEVFNSYNQGQSKSLGLGVTPNGIGLCLRF